MANDPEDRDSSEVRERTAFEDLVGKLLKVPKDEVDELRKQIEKEQEKDT